MQANFILAPQNIALLRKHYNFDQGAYQASRGKLEKITQKGQVSMQDYSHLIEDQYFTDTIHLNEQGNYLVAKQLVQDLAPRLEVTDR